MLVMTIYFCETGVPPGQRYNSGTFRPNDPLWDGQGCGPTSTCCTFNNSHGFVNNYLGQLMLFWRSDCAQLILYVLKTLQ